MTYVRYHELLTAIKNRVNTDKMKRILGGNTRIYLQMDDYSDPEDDEDLPWGRLIIAPTSNLWPEIQAPGFLWKFGVLFRVEFNNFQRTGYSAQVSLEAAHAEIQAMIQGWIPTPMVYIQVAFPFFLHQPPQPIPLWDETRNLYWLSSTYRAEVTKPAPIPETPTTLPFALTLDEDDDWTITPDAEPEGFIALDIDGDLAITAGPGSGLEISEVTDDDFTVETP